MSVLTAVKNQQLYKWMFGINWRYSFVEDTAEMPVQKDKRPPQVPVQKDNQPPQTPVMTST